MIKRPSNGFLFVFGTPVAVAIIVGVVLIAQQPEPAPISSPTSGPVVLTVMSTDYFNKNWRLDAVNVLPTAGICQLEGKFAASNVLTIERIVYFTCDTGNGTSQLNTVRDDGRAVRYGVIDRANVPFDFAPRHQGQN